MYSIVQRAWYEISFPCFPVFLTYALFRCCKLDIQSPEANFWEDLESKIMESIRNTLDRRVQFYEDEIRKLSEQRLMPVWNFCNFFILKVVPFCQKLWIKNVVKGALASRRNALIINWDFSMSYFAFYSSSKYHFTKDHTFQISSSTFIDGSDILPI